MNLTRWSARLSGTRRRRSGTRRTSTERAHPAVPPARGADPHSPPQSADSVPVRSVAAALLSDQETALSDAPRLDFQAVLADAPAPVVVTHGQTHQVAYVNRAYRSVFGARSPGKPAHETLPELRELGVLPLLDQVFRSGRPRTVRVRRRERRTSGRAGEPDDGAAHGEASSYETTTGRAPGDRVSGDGVTDGAMDDGREDISDDYFSFVCAPIRATPEDHAPDTDPPGTVTPSRTPPGGARSNPSPLRSALRLPGRLPGRLSSWLPGLLTTRQRASPRDTDPVSGVLVYATDVTGHVQATERLRDRERRQRETAVTLQHSLLPQELEQPDDLQVGAVYQPGGAETAVGGDWYDVITLGGGRTALVIGDVMGRGVRAATVMGQLRTAVRAYARLDLPPHEVLQLLDGIARSIDSTQIATCLYAVHDPGEGGLSFASAGHPPLVIRDADGHVSRIKEQAGPPLGTGDWPHTSGFVPLAAGSTAVLYTDGLVERRDEDIDEGLRALEVAVEDAQGAPSAVCDRLLRTMGISQDHDDDVAVLVFHLPEQSPEQATLFRGAALDLIGGAEAAPRARAFSSGVLASWRLSERLCELGVLAVSELVANSLTHGTPPMRLRLRRTDRRLIIEVADGNEQLPRRRAPGPTDETGRGVALVSAIARDWGARRTLEGGKSVWCEFDLPGGDSTATGGAASPEDGEAHQR